VLLKGKPSTIKSVHFFSTQTAFDNGAVSTVPSAFLFNSTHIAHRDNSIYFASQDVHDLKSNMLMSTKYVLIIFSEFTQSWTWFMHKVQQKFLYGMHVSYATNHTDANVTQIRKLITEPISVYAT